MWFKQITCDNCFKILDNIGRHNCYVMLRILQFNKVQSDNQFNGYIPYQTEYPFVFASFNQIKKLGNAFMYSVNSEDYTLNNRTWFCCNKCAHEFAKKKNLIMYYYDENLDSVRAINPHMIEINKELDSPDKYKGLVASWGDREWIISSDKYKDLKKYNVNKVFPELITKNFRLTWLYKSNKDKKDFINILKDEAFQFSFWGSSNISITTKKIIEHIEFMRINYGRRLGIEWMIRKDGKIYGFVRIHCISPSDPHNWYIEFGISKEFRGLGYMKEVIPIVLQWCKYNCLENIYAISETNNIACYRLLKGLPYHIDIKKIDAYDTNAGNRKIYRYSIKLNNK